MSWANCSLSSRLFQSALPRGERLQVRAIVIALINVSIRAPAGGATADEVEPALVGLFQSALPRGERRSI